MAWQWRQPAKGAEKPTKSFLYHYDSSIRLARLALDDDKEDADIDRSDLEICEYEPVSKSWLTHEQRGQRDKHVRDMERLLGNHQKKIMMRFESMFGEVCARLKKAELAVDTLTTKTQQQADQIAPLEKRLAALEDSKEQNEHRRRALNLVIESLNAEKKNKGRKHGVGAGAADDQVRSFL